MFDELSEIYEALIDWPRRLQNEAPFYRALFERVGAETVLDVACGTGHHAALFHEWGLRVEGADISPEMIARARSRCGEPPGLRWIERGFDQPCSRPGRYDVALCVGNSLALAASEEKAERAVTQLLNALRPGGAAVIQLLNLQRLPIGPCMWQKTRVIHTARGARVVLKGVHRLPACGYVDIAVVDPADGRLLHHGSERLLSLSEEFVTGVAERHGADAVACYGGYGQQPYEAKTSGDLLVVARTADTSTS